MKTRNTITKLIAITMAVAALVCVAGLVQPVHAQTGDGSVRSVSYGSVGIIPGQRLSVTVLNPKEGGQPVRVQAYIYDAPGRLIVQTDSVELQPGQFHTFKINREDLHVAGEDVTGRLQVLASVQVVLMDGSVRAVKIPVWMELVDTRTGSTSGGDYYTGTVTVSGDGE